MNSRKPHQQQRQPEPGVHIPPSTGLRLRRFPKPERRTLFRRLAGLVYEAEVLKNRLEHGTAAETPLTLELFDRYRAAAARVAEAMRDAEEAVRE